MDPSLAGLRVSISAEDYYYFFAFTLLGRYYDAGAPHDKLFLGIKTTINDDSAASANLYKGPGTLVLAPVFSRLTIFNARAKSKGVWRAACFIWIAKLYAPVRSLAYIWESL